MKKRVYIETSFVSYLKAWPSRDLVMAAHQQLTIEWWDGCRDDYEMCASQLVIEEASAGDPVAAQERMAVLNAMTMVETTPDAVVLSKELVRVGALPKKAEGDALHIAIAATQGIPFLLTWNCRHMANAAMRPVIESVCAAKGFRAPIICTPEELMEIDRE